MLSYFGAVTHCVDMLYYILTYWHIYVSYICITPKYDNFITIACVGSHDSSCWGVVWNWWDDLVTVLRWLRSVRTPASCWQLASLVISTDVSRLSVTFLGLYSRWCDVQLIYRSITQRWSMSLVTTLTCHNTKEMIG